MFSSSFFPKLRGQFTHGTVRANVFFSYNFNVFFKRRNKKKHIIKRFISFIKYLNNITHVWGGSNNLSTMNMYVHIHVHYNIPVYKVTSRCFAVLKLKIGNKYEIYN